MDKRFRILAVDDEYVNIQLLKSVLCEEYDIFTAQNGHEAIDKIEQYRPDLILLDVMMPDITGFEVCEIIKADERFADIPIIFLTALDSQDDQLQGLELGGIDYLTKPINFALLKLRVGNHLLLKEQRDLLQQKNEELAQLLADQELQNKQLYATKAALRQSEEMYRTLFEQSPDGIVLWSMPDLKAVQCNTAAQNLHGYSHEEFTSLTVPDIEATLDPVEVENTRKALLREGVARFDSVHRTKTGELRHVIVSLKTIELEGQSMILDIHRDITERKRVEDALKDAEWKFRALFDNGPIGVAYHSMIYDESGTAVDYFFIDANENYIALTGVDPRGKTVTQAFPGIENDPFDWIGTFGKVARTGENIHFEQYLHANDRWYDVVGYQYKPEHFVASFVEITDRKKAEERLQREQNMLARTESIAHVGSWEWEIATDTVIWSDELFRIFNRNPAEGAPSYEEHPGIYHPDDMKELSRVAGIAQRDGTPYELELRVVRPNGDIRICLARGGGERGPDGKIIRLFGSLQDITERKQIEEVQSYLLQMGSLSPDEDFFESLARYLAKILGMDYVCIDRLQGNCLSVKTLAVYHDGRFEDNVEYTLKDTPCGDVVGKEVCVFPRGVCSLFPQDQALQDLHAESYVGTTLWSFDMKPIGLIAVIGRKELTSSHFAESVLKLVAIRAAGELERRQVEEDKLIVQQLFQQAQKLESLGVLAGGIAHDFNNILAIIIGHCSLAAMDPETANEHIPPIEKAADRAAGLCRQMLAYAGKAMFVLTQVNMAALVDEMVQMLKATSNQNVVIKPDLSPDVPTVNGDASQLRQIVMNLIINASEAIGDAQGVIHISLTKRTIKAGQAADHLGKTIPSGEYACLEVSDTGCGMDDETMHRIFEPFYTTKFTGRGLGMSAVLGIIKAHNGALQLVSQPGEGTTFTIYLPIESKEPIGDDSSEHIASTPLQGSGTVLLVEDEDQVKLVAKAMLEALGFKVFEASNGREALELYQNNASDITLVLTDIGMPVMNGYTLFRELKTLKPELPIIISSGFGDTVVTTRIPAGEIAGLVSKPYRFDKLQDVLKKALEGNQTQG